MLTSIFIENLVMSMGGALSHTLITSTTACLSSKTSTIGSQLMTKNSDISYKDALGSSSISIGTSVSLSGPTAYDQTLKQMEMTQAYIEALDEQQMLELITRLDIKESELEEIESSKQKAKLL